MSPQRVIDAAQEHPGTLAVGVLITILLGLGGWNLATSVNHSNDLAAIKEDVTNLTKSVEHYSASVDKQIGQVVNVAQEQAKELATLRQAIRDGSKRVGGGSDYAP